MKKKEPEKKPLKKGITLGDMLEFWKKDRGSFNVQLYTRISMIKTTQA